MSAYSKKWDKPTQWAWTGRAQTCASKEGDMMYARQLMASPYTFGNLEQIRTAPPDFKVTNMYQRPQEYGRPCATNTSRNNDTEYMWHNKPAYLKRAKQLPIDLIMTPKVHEQGDVPRRNPNRHFDVPIIPPEMQKVFQQSVAPRGPSVTSGAPGWQDHGPGKLDNEPDWQSHPPAWQARPHAKVEDNSVKQRAFSARPATRPILNTTVPKVLCHEIKHAPSRDVSAHESIPKPRRIQSASVVRSSLPSTATPGRPLAGTVYRPKNTMSYYHHEHFTGQNSRTILRHSREEGIANKKRSIQSNFNFGHNI